MAVYTKLSKLELIEFFSKYNLGDLLNYSEIKEGIENTNYFIQTSKGKFILTLYEKRVDEKDLPFFISLMKNLNDKNFPTPKPIINKNGNYISDIAKKKAAVMSFLDGKAKKKLNANECYEIGIYTAKLHLITKNLSDKQISVNPKISDFIINNVERSYEKMFKFLKEVDELSLSTGKSININLIKKVLDQ